MKAIKYIFGATALVAFLLALPVPDASATSQANQTAEQAPVMFSALEDAAIARQGKAKIYKMIRLAQGQVDLNKADLKAKKQVIQNQKKKTSQSPAAAQKKKKGEMGSKGRSLNGGDIGIPQKK